VFWKAVNSIVLTDEFFDIVCCGVVGNREVNEHGRGYVGRDCFW
jgi:hypothetical protein